MQDFYNNEQYDSDLGRLQLEGLKLNYQLNDPYYDFDYLKTKYPAFADRIQKARDKGFRDEQIATAFENAERRMNFFSKKEQVNNFLGRTPETMQEVAGYENIRMMSAYRKAYPDKSDDDIFTAVGLSQWSGISTRTLLENPKLVKKLTEGQKVREGFFESIQRGANNYLVHNDKGAEGLQFIFGHRTREELLAKENDFNKKLIDEPIVTNFANRIGAGTSGIMAQGYKNMGKGLLAGGAVALPFGAAGAFVGHGVGGAKLGFKIGYTAANAWELFEDQAGNDVYEFLKLKDENGQPLDENAARVAALITGAITTVTELYTLPGVMKLIPGGDKLAKLAGLDRQAVIDTVQSNPVVRDAFSHMATDIAKGIGWGTINNVVEAIGTDLGVPLAQAISRQPFPKIDKLKYAQNVVWPHMKEAAITSIRDFSGSAIFNLPFQMYGFNKWAQNYKKTITEAAAQLNMPVEQVEQLYAEAIKQEQLRQNSQTDTQQVQPQQPATAPETIQVQTDTPAETITPEAQQEQPKYIFIPRKEFEEYKAQHQELDNIQGFNAGNETGFTSEQFEQLKQIAPDFTASVISDTRYGADAATISEGLNKLTTTDTEKAENFHSDENQQAIQQVTENFMNAGEKQEKAELAGQIFGAIRASILTREGVAIPVPRVMNAEQMQEQDSDFSRIAPEYDINNPDTWQNQERAQKFKELTNWEKLSDTERNIKELLDVLTGRKPEKAEELSEKTDEVMQGLREEAPNKIKSSRNELLRQEYEDYITTLNNSAKDVADTIRTRETDTALYDFNAEFPAGKKRHPDESYYFENFDGKTRIDFATDKLDLKIRVKSPANKTPLIFSIKNYRNAYLRQVLNDVLGGNSLAGIQLSETPTGQYIAQALNSFWRDNDLQKMPVRSIDTDTINAPEVHSIKTDTLQAPEVHKLTPNIHVQNNAVPLDEALSPTDRTNMPAQARFRLAQDEAAWRETVDDLLTDPNINTNSRKPVQVMHTPLVFTLTGAEHRILKINNGKLKKIINKHPAMTDESLKDIARAITDPVAIFESKLEGKHPSRVVLTELKDNNGASIAVAVHLDYDGNVNKLASAYGKDNRGKPNNQWFAQQVAEDKLMYINREKAAQWAQETGVELLHEGETTYAKTEQDLINLWNEHKQEGFYYTDPNTGEHTAFTSWKFGRALINIVKAGNFAGHVHEVGHVTFDFMYNLAKSGSVQMNEDFETILRHADVTREQWEAEKPNQKGGAREKAHEYFAKAFEVYLSEGKAPTKTLQNTFDRVRKFLLEIYDDITNQLGVQIDDEVREVFDRLFTIQGDDTESVADYAMDEMRMDNQIKTYQAMLRSEEEAFREQIETAQDYKEHKEHWELDPQAVQLVDEYVRGNDDIDLQRNIEKARHDEVESIYQAIRELGGIQADDVIDLMGKEKAADISKKWRGIYRKNGLASDILAQYLVAKGFQQFSGHDGIYAEGDSTLLLEWLDNNSRIHKKFPDVLPTVEINTNTVNAFLAAEGVDGTIEYLKKRLKYIMPMIEDADTPIGEGEKLHNERLEINEWLKRLDPEFDKDIKPAKKKAVSKRDLRQAITTGYKIGQGEEREVQNLRREVDKLSWQERIEELKERHRQAREDDKLRWQERTEKLEEKYRQAREADKANYQTRLETIMQRLNDKNNQRLQRLEAQHQRKISQIKQRIEKLKNFQARYSERRKINHMVKSIVRMSKSKSISYDRLQDIQRLLEGYNLSRKSKGIKHHDIIRSFLDMENLQNAEQDIEQQLEEAGITQQDVEEFLEKVHIEDMPLSEVEGLFQHVTSLFQQGRREFAVWQQERNNRRAELAQRMSSTILSNTKAPKPRVISGHEDIQKQYTLGKVGEIAHHYWDAVQTPGRFLDSLGSNFRQIFEDGFTERRAEAYRYIHQREQALISRLRQLGLSIPDLFNYAFELDGKNYTWEEIFSIYNGMKNDKHAAAIIWGNFVSNPTDKNKMYSTPAEALNAINKILNFINQPENQNYKTAADLFLQDFDEHYERINEANIRNFNRGMNKVENYTPMFRLRHQSSQGLINSETEQLGANGQKNILLHKVADNFMQSRQEINALNQQPIDLHAVSVWFKAMYMQEYNAALAGYASDIVSALLLRGENGSVQELIKSRLGMPDWDTLRSIFNDSITDRDIQEQEAANKIADYFIAARSAAYVPFRLSTAVSQFASYFAALPYSSRGHLFRSLAKAIEMAGQRKINEFLENVYQKSPELRYTGGDPVDKIITERLKQNSAGFKNATLNKGANLARQAMSWGYEGVRVVDNWTKAIVFDAVYNSRLEEGYSEKDAIRFANRAVHDTQPASTNRESARFLRGKGVSRLVFSQFMNSLVPLFDMAFVDVARNIAHPSMNTVKVAAWNTLAVCLSLAFAQGVKDIFSGNLPSGQELDNGQQDDWPKWISDTISENLINTAPIFNRLANLVRTFKGNKQFRTEDRIIEPFEHITKGMKYAFGDDYEDDNNGKALEEIMHGLALIGVPIPFAGLREFLRFFVDDKENN